MAAPYSQPSVPGTRISSYAAPRGVLWAPTAYITPTLTLWLNQTHIGANKLNLGYLWIITLIFQPTFYMLKSDGKPTSRVPPLPLTPWDAAVFIFPLLICFILKLPSFCSDYSLLVSWLNLSYCLEWRENSSSVISVGSPACLQMKSNILPVTDYYDTYFFFCNSACTCNLICKPKHLDSQRVKTKKNKKTGTPFKHYTNVLEFP